MKAKLRLPDKFAGMSKAEREWALLLEADVRRPLLVIGHLANIYVVRWQFESVRFVLAKGTGYLPDFWVLYSDGHVECHEVKQAWKNGKHRSSSHWKTSIAKLKIAAEKFSEIVWVVCERQVDGTWTETSSEDLFKRKKP